MLPSLAIVSPLNDSDSVFVARGVAYWPIVVIVSSGRGLFVGVRRNLLDCWFAQKVDRVVLLSHASSIFGLVFYIFYLSCLFFWMPSSTAVTLFRYIVWLILFLGASAVPRSSGLGVL